MSKNVEMSVVISHGQSARAYPLFLKEIYSTDFPYQLWVQGKPGQRWDYVGTKSEKGLADQLEAAQVTIEENDPAYPAPAAVVYNAAKGSYVFAKRYKEAVTPERVGWGAARQEESNGLA